MTSPLVVVRRRVRPPASSSQETKSDVQSSSEPKPPMSFHTVSGSTSRSVVEVTERGGISSFGLVVIRLLSDLQGQLRTWALAQRLPRVGGLGQCVAAGFHADLACGGDGHELAVRGT